MHSIYCQNAFLLVGWVYFQILANIRLKLMILDISIYLFAHDNIDSYPASLVIDRDRLMSENSIDPIYLRLTQVRLGYTSYCHE